MFDQPILSYKLVCNGQDPLTNAFVTTRKPHTCTICEETIGAGERVRRETRRSADGEQIETRHVCRHCCEAIARHTVGDWGPISARYELAKKARAS
ncbi:hypothetical protein [Mesorhizobium sp. M1399]|uniref:hypothetical protein n=1 Tax=Mesorhizobium sp. M1399 TaxID=2957096 RepID=UPI00333DCC8F